MWGQGEGGGALSKQHKQHPTKPNNSKYKQRRYDKDIEAVMFVPYTPGSKLVRALQEAEDKWAELLNHPKWRMVERSGSKLKDLLSNTTPWDNNYCGRQDCWVCETNPEAGPKSCWTENTTYKISCKQCTLEGTSAEYYAETACTIYQRTKEHRAQLNKNVEDSPL